MIDEGTDIELEQFQNLLDTICLHGYGAIDRIYYTFVFLKDSDLEDAIEVKNRKVSFVLNVNENTNLAIKILLTIELLTDLELDNRALCEDIEDLFCTKGLIKLEKEKLI